MKFFYTSILTVLFFLLGKTGQAQSGVVLDFKGDDDYIMIPAPTFTAYTIEARVKFKAGSINNQTIIVFTNGDPMSQWSHRISTTSDGRFNHYLYDGSLRSTTGSIVIEADKWYTVSVTAADNGIMLMYVNGVLDGSAFIGSLWKGGNQFHVGRASSGPNRWFSGQLDEVRIWDVVRTATDIKANMNTTFSSPQTGLIRLYNFEHGNPGSSNAALVNDLSGNNINGTLNGFVLNGSTSNFVSFTGVLPVKLNQFSLNKEKNGVRLQWSTLMEANSSHFVIERSIDGKMFTPIAKVNASGNSTTLVPYSSLDTQPSAGMNYYRLKMVDQDGAFAYSKVQTVQVQKGGNTSLQVSRSGSAIKYIIRASKPGQGKLMLYNSAGQLVTTQAVLIHEGITSQELATEKLTSQVHYYQLLVDGEGIVRGKF